MQVALPRELASGLSRHSQHNEVDQPERKIYICGFSPYLRSSSRAFSSTSFPSSLVYGFNDVHTLLPLIDVPRPKAWYSHFIDILVEVSWADTGHPPGVYILPRHLCRGFLYSLGNWCTEYPHSCALYCYRYQYPGSHPGLQGRLSFFPIWFHMKFTVVSHYRVFLRFDLYVVICLSHGV